MCFKGLAKILLVLFMLGNFVYLFLLLCELQSNLNNLHNVKFSCYANVPLSISL